MTNEPIPPWPSGGPFDHGEVLSGFMECFFGLAAALEAQGLLTYDQMARAMRVVRKQAEERGASSARMCVAAHMESFFLAVDAKPHPRPRLTIHDGGKPAA